MDFEFKQPLLRDLNDRGFIHSATGSLEALESDIHFSKAPVFCGFDCTADSLHVGSLMALTMLKKFHAAGHKIIIVIGTATTRIGDPSGKDEARPFISEEQVLKNSNGIVSSIDAVIGTRENVEVKFNSAWLEDINWFEFLRHFGAHISVSNMLRLDSVSNRLEKEAGMSFLEFNYSLFQAMDFVHLAKENDNLIQIGGSDQWGNITMGTELVRRTIGKQVWGITTPLLLNSDGEKMGKTAKGAVWLNSGAANGPGKSHLSDFDFWQFWRSVDDEAVFRFMKLFSSMNLVAINAIQAKNDVDSINNMKKALATTVTSTVRGTEAALKAQHTAEELFEKGKTSTGLPTFTITGVSGEVARLVHNADMANSVTAARKLIQQGGVRINNVKVKPDTVLTEGLFVGGQLKLSVGKKKHKLIKLGV